MSNLAEARANIDHELILSRLNCTVSTAGGKKSAFKMGKGLEYIFPKTSKWPTDT